MPSAFGYRSHDIGFDGCSERAQQVAIRSGEVSSEEQSSMVELPFLDVFHRTSFIGFLMESSEVGSSTIELES